MACQQHYRYYEKLKMIETDQSFASSLWLVYTNDNEQKHAQTYNITIIFIIIIPIMIMIIIWTQKKKKDYWSWLKIPVLREPYKSANKNSLSTLLSTLTTSNTTTVWRWDELIS